MPAKKVIEKEDILNAALEIVRESGVEALNMRSLAKKCNCSTQPIYLSFKGMKELKEEILQKITTLFSESIEEDILSGKYPEYKAVGMGYIRFAKEEKQLFKFLLMSKHEENRAWEGVSFDVSTDIIMKSYGFTKEQSNLLHTEMWIFVHGIASMIATDYFDWDMELVSKMVTNAFMGFISVLKGENK